MRVSSVVRALPVAVAALTVVLTSCGGGSDAGTAETAPANSTPTTAATTAPTTAPTTGAAATGAGAAGAEPASGAARAQPVAGDLTNFSCEKRGGAWSARGHITNSATEPMVYTVTVVTVAGTEVSGEETEEFLLEPDESAGFDLPGIARGPADACMPRLLRAPR